MTLIEKPIYRNVDVDMWDDENFLALSSAPANARDLWFYLLTGKCTGIIPGLYVFFVLGTAEYFRWNPKATQACFEEILDQGMARYDRHTRLLWLPKALAHGRNAPASANVVKSWRRMWRALPKCDLKMDAQVAMQLVLDGMGKSYGDAFRQVTGEVEWEASPNQYSKPSGRFPRKPPSKPSSEASEEGLPHEEEQAFLEGAEQDRVQDGVHSGSGSGSGTDKEKIPDPYGGNLSGVGRTTSSPVMGQPVLREPRRAVGDRIGS